MATEPKRIELHPQAALEVVTAEKEFYRNRAVLLQHMHWESEQASARLREELKTLRAEIACIREGMKGADTFVAAHNGELSKGATPSKLLDVPPPKAN